MVAGMRCCAILCSGCTAAPSAWYTQVKTDPKAFMEYAMPAGGDAVAHLGHPGDIGGRLGQAFVNTA